MHVLLLATLILSAFSPSAPQRHGAAPAGGVTIVERLRSELLSVLGDAAGAADDVRLSAQRSNPVLTPASGDVSLAMHGIEHLEGQPELRPTLRRGSSCWWLWLLFGVDACQ